MRYSKTNLFIFLLLYFLCGLTYMSTQLSIHTDVTSLCKLRLIFPYTIFAHSVNGNSIPV